MRYIPPKPRFIRLVARTVHGAPTYTGRVTKPAPVLVARVIRRRVTH